MSKKYYNIDTKTLTLPFNFNEELKDLPSDTRIIIFEEDYHTYEYSKFNQSVDNLPTNLSNLTFGFWFNQEVDNLPNNLTHLIFGWHFDQSVDNLPKNLTHLTFGYRFNQKIDNLPQTLTHLTVRRLFNQKVDNLPSNIKHINIYQRQFNLFKKIPFDCKIIDEDNKEIFL